MHWPDQPSSGLPPESRRAATDHGHTPPLGGVLVVDKPAGPTSMQVVAAVRRRAGGVRTGHAGTLDPLATGILVLALGQATRLIERLMATDKRYQTMIDLSAFTTTDDREGERREVAVGNPPSRDGVEQAVNRFIGTIMQRPPAFSAMKVGGRRAYKLARQGESVELPPRPVNIHALHIERYEWPMLDLSLHCGKGVYVRSLARDVGLALGTGGHCASLRRTAVGPFDESMAVELQDVPLTLPQSLLLNGPEALRLIADQQ